MATIYATHSVDTSSEHYASVREYAEKAESCPSIRAFWSKLHGAWFSVEGSHRLAVCDELGYVPAIIDVTGQSVADHDLDLSCYGYSGPMDLSDPSVVDLLTTHHGPAYRYEDCDVDRGRS